MIILKNKSAENNMHIGIYFKKKLSKENPFIVFKNKAQSYLDFCEHIKGRGHRLFLICGKSSHAGDMRFNDVLEYSKEEFVEISGGMHMDVIYDRSIDLEFPLDGIVKVLNSAKFKCFCADKHAMYELVGEFMPEEYEVRNKKEVCEVLEYFKKDPLVVYKPINGMGGKGIYIDSPQRIVNYAVDGNYVLQKFVNTAAGIKGISDTLHDLRLVLVGKQIAFMHIRTPKKDSLISNVANGGMVKEVRKEELPKNVLLMVEKIAEKLCNSFGKNVYSLDFGVEKGRPYLFEINDVMGFPGKDFSQKECFYELTCDLLEEKATHFE